MVDENTDRVIINFTPTGMIPTKRMTAFVPITCTEIVEDVHQAYELGLTMLHLHARDEKTGEPTYKADVYAKLIEGIRAFAPDLVICVSLSGRTFKTFEERSEALKLDGILKPDMGSLTLSSLNFNQQTSVNEPSMVQALAEEMKRRNIKPELEAFDSGMINYARYLAKKGLISPPYYFNLILGNIACAQADVLHAGVMVNDLPENSLWSVGGIGHFQLVMNSVAVAIGGGVRIGLEDNIWFDKERTRLAKNIDLLKRIHAIAKANGREFMSPAELRIRLKLKKGDGEYGTHA